MTAELSTLSAATLWAESLARRVSAVLLQSPGRDFAASVAATRILSSIGITSLAKKIQIMKLTSKLSKIYI